jgi:site-specific DNA recombinase
VWNTDRLLRRSSDLARLIDLGDTGYREMSAQGEYNLADADHRFVLRVLVAQAEKQSDDAQRRIKRRFQTLRENGIAHFRGRCFGFPGRDLTWTHRRTSTRKPTRGRRYRRS